MKRFAAIVLYTVIATALAALLLEAGLRISGKYRTYSEKIGQGYRTYYGEAHESWLWTYNPNDTFTLDHGEFQFEYTTNPTGLREKSDFEDSAGIRLAVFGDSFTEGVGADYDSSWPRELERILRTSGRRAAVYNAGMSGSDPFYAHLLLREKILAKNPTHVIFTSNGNDLADVIFRSGFDRFQPNGHTVNRKAPALESWYRKSHLIRFAAEEFRGMDETLIPAAALELEKQQAASAIKSCLDSTYRICRDREIKFLFITHIPPQALCDKPPSWLDVRYFYDYDYRYPHIFLEDQFRDYIEPSACYEYCWETDGHFNARGYSLMGQLIHREVEASYPGFWESAKN